VIFSKAGDDQVPAATPPRPASQAALARQVALPALNLAVHSFGKALDPMAAEGIMYPCAHPPDDGSSALCPH
jgi:hypothetical protein